MTSINLLKAMAGNEKLFKSHYVLNASNRIIIHEEQKVIYLIYAKVIT